jgi:hypothetical protein
MPLPVAPALPPRADVVALQALAPRAAVVVLALHVKQHQLQCSQRQQMEVDGCLRDLR